MEQSATTERIYTLEPNRTDYSISSLMGLSISVVTFLFAIVAVAIETAQIHFFELLQGDFHTHGDPSLLYFAIFMISATILLVVQHHFQVPIEDEE